MGSPNASRILLATGNPAKAAKLRWLLHGLNLAPEDLSAHPDIRLPDETGASFAENARRKAEHASQAFGGLALASDGGVLIPALGAAWDALRTGRAAGPSATDEERARHLLALAAGLQGDARRVLWSEAVAVARNGQTLEAWEATGTEGVLTTDYDPANAIPGFWVYSLWSFPQLGKRYVDLPPAELDAMDTVWPAIRERVQRWFTDGNASG